MSDSLEENDGYDPLPIKEIQAEIDRALADNTSYGAPVDSDKRARVILGLPGSRLEPSIFPDATSEDEAEKFARQFSFYEKVLPADSWDELKKCHAPRAEIVTTSKSSATNKPGVE